MQIEDFKLFIAVDDNEAELFLTKAILQDSYPGLHCHCEKDTARLSDHFRRAAEMGVEPAAICVLLDIRMPRTNGFELIYKLRNDLDSHACCILMLSASRGPSDRADSAAIGADGFIAKPFKVEALRAALALVRRNTTAAA